MDPRTTRTEDLDLEISVAYIALSGAREVWARCPVPENRYRVDEARAEVDRLLERRSAAHT